MLTLNVNANLGLGLRLALTVDLTWYMLVMTLTYYILGLAICCRLYSFMQITVAVGPGSTSQYKRSDQFLLSQLA